MKEKLHLTAAIALSLVLCVLFGAVLLMYARPMEDVSLDLSLSPQEDVMETDPEAFDSKGWTVYTRDGDTVTELEADGFGGYTGLELGQTFYYSRVMAEELESPTLQIGVVDQMFTVWLDDTLLYTDCPELDNRIGHITLPMNEWDREDPIIVSLPMNYQGKTLTIAQSFPPYSETGSVRAYPAGVKLYCGYAYESSLVSESFATAIAAVAAFAVGVLMLLAFIRSRDWGLVCLALVAFLWMALQLTGTSFFFQYFGTFDNDPVLVIRHIPVAALLVFLATRGGKHRNLLWIILGVYGLSILVHAAFLFIYPDFDFNDRLPIFLTQKLPHWLAMAGLVTVLVLGAVFWRKESWFYRVFTPIALVGAALHWIVLALFLEKGTLVPQLLLSLGSGEVTFIYHRTFPIIGAAALFTAILGTLRSELTRRTEQRLLEMRRTLALESYENMRRQHEEVMMLRHDMAGHLEALKSMVGTGQAAAYLDDLIGQNKQVRPVVHTGNETLDIILNSKLHAARDAGIHVEILRAQAPESLPLSDTDLCSVVMNIMNNAITGASDSGAEEPFIKLDIHIKDTWFAIICENTAIAPQNRKRNKKETVPKHGLGMKIIENIARRNNGLFDKEYGENYYKVRFILPMG